MQPAADQLRVRLESTSFTPPSGVAVYGVDVKTHTTAEGIRAGLVKQLYTPVYWAATVRTMVTAGGPHIRECGPAKGLTGLKPGDENKPSPQTTAPPQPPNLDPCSAAQVSL